MYSQDLSSKDGKMIQHENDNTNDDGIFEKLALFADLIFGVE